MSLRPRRALLLSLLLCAACVRAQDAAAVARQAGKPASEPKPAGELKPASELRPAAELWLARVSVLTDDLSKDAAALPDFARAMLWARLGEAWWTDDGERARGWLRRAVEAVETGPEGESAAARAGRVDAARRLLPIVAPRDRELGRRLSALLTRRAADGPEGDAEQSGNAEALAQAAEAALASDPPLALALASDSLRAGTSFRLVGLSHDLRRRDPKLADLLFAEGLARAQATADAELFDLLSGVAFPAQTYPGVFPPDQPAPPDAARARLLALIAGRLSQPAATRQEEELTCAYAWNAARLLAEFTRLLPAQSAATHAVVRRCQSILQSPRARQRMDDDISARDLTTAQSLLDAAADADDEKLSLSYRMRAAYRFYGEGKPERALEVLAAFSPREYEENKGVVENWRWWFSALAALKRLREGDLYGARKTVEAVPADSRAYALTHLLHEMSGERERKAIPEELRRAVALEYIGETRRLLARAGDASGAAYQNLVGLVKLSGEYAPADAPEILRDAAAAANRDESPTVTPQGQPIRSSEQDSLQPHELPASLLDADETTTLQAIASITSAERRARLRLGLLASALAERRRAPKNAPPAKDAPPRGRRAARP